MNDDENLCLRKKSSNDISLQKIDIVKVADNDAKSAVHFSPDRKDIAQPNEDITNKRHLDYNVIYHATKRYRRCTL